MRRDRMFLLLSLFLALFLTGCQPADSYQGRLILSGDHRIDGNHPVPGHLVIVDGRVDLAPEGRVAGSVVVLGGELRLGGEVEGDLTVLKGRVYFSDQARIHGNLNAGGGHLLGWEEAEIEGEVTENIGLDLPVEVLAPNRSFWDRAGRGFWYALLMAGMALLGGWITPRGVERVGQAVIQHTLVCGSLGGLVLLVGPVLIVQMMFTVVLIPAAAVAVLLGAITLSYGLSGAGWEIGRRVFALLGWEPQPALAAGLGGFLVSLIINLLNFIPFIGGLLALGAAAVVLGGVLLTRYGTRVFIPKRRALPED